MRTFKRIIYFLLIFFIIGFVNEAKAFNWNIRFSTNPNDVVNFLNGVSPYENPVAEAKISAIWTGEAIKYEIFYRYSYSEDISPRWGWKKSTSISDVVCFLNGKSPYRYPIKNAMISGVYRGYTEFYIFYQFGEPSMEGNWNVNVYYSSNEVLNSLNGISSVPKGNIEVCSVYKDSTFNQKKIFYLFYKTPWIGQASNLWRVVKATSLNEVADLLNGPGALQGPIIDGKKVASISIGSHTYYYVFIPQGLLAVTRPKFANHFGTYAQWKLKQGLETYILIAEWIDSHFGGNDIRYRIRNCLRNYYYLSGVRYAMLVGDSINTPMGYPPPPVLSTDWNLPAGYYEMEVWDAPQYTTYFYSDLTDKVYYSDNEHYWAGDYKIYVGVIPVRTVDELKNVLYKSMNYEPANEAHFLFSYECYYPGVPAFFQSIEGIAGPDYSLDLTVFPKGTSDSYIYRGLFEQNGVIYESAHGNVSLFNMSDLYIFGHDAKRFTQINPAYITTSCSVYMYMKGESLYEDFLKASKGPAVLMTHPTSFPQNAESIGSLTAAFWEDLFNGATTGEAFYDNGKGIYMNPSHLFGDPSLVIFSPMQ